MAFESHALTVLTASAPPGSRTSPSRDCQHRRPGHGILNATVSVGTVEIVRGLWEAFQAALRSGDVGAWFDSDLLAPDAELVAGSGLVGGRRQLSWS